MSRLEAARDRFLAQAEEHERSSVGDAPFLRALRSEGRERFAALGLPDTRQEEWRYTSLAPIAEVDFETPGAAALTPDRDRIEAISFPVFACSLFVFVDGRHEPALSSPRALAGGLSVESLARLRAEQPSRLEGRLGSVVDTKSQPFAALNTAMLDDGALVTVPRGTRVEHAIHLVFVSTGDAPLACHPRVLIEAEPDSRATVIQDHVSLRADASMPRFTNALTEVRVGANALLDLVVVQRENAASRMVTQVAATQERDARFACHTVTLGGRLVRNELSVLLGDTGADCTLNGLFLGTGDQVVDNHTLVDHAMPHCTSRELYKGVLGGRSRGVFRGRVIVRPDAQKTSAEQSNPNLLLTDGAEIDTKPQLEIWADDVKCSHGSAIGRLDPDALFYLRTRGIGERAARDLLTRGFAQEILDALPHAALTEALGAQLDERLRAARSAS